MTRVLSPDRRPLPYPTGYSKLFWGAFAVGSVVMAVGIRGLLVNSGSIMDTNPSRWIVLFVAVIGVHDLVLVPVVMAVGWAVRRLVPPPLRAVVQAGLICSAVVVAFAYPFVRRFGAMALNETILPRDYARGLLILLALVWAVTASVAAALWRGRTALPVSDGDNPEPIEKEQRLPRVTMPAQAEAVRRVPRRR